MLLEQIGSETAGDPMSEHKWIRSSLRNVSKQLKEAGHAVSHTTVGRLLKKAGYGLHVNAKKEEASANHPQRDEQFKHIEAQRFEFYGANQPVISVDTKKKELIGNFKQAGQRWSLAGEAVNCHDFASEGLGRAVPYGIYDLRSKEGSVYVGQSADTAEFAVAALERWWQEAGQSEYSEAQKLLILADSGGCNGCRVKLWKVELQRFSDESGLEIVVSHYPTGCSKWNPIEHQLFSPISGNWAGLPLRSFEIMLGALRGTTTRGGLKVRAELVEGEFKKGQKVSPAELRELNIEYGAVCPRWNYTIRPRGTSPRVVANFSSN